MPSAAVWSGVLPGDSVAVFQCLARRSLGGDGARVLPHEVQTRGRRIDLHAITFAELALQDAHGQWVEHEPLDGALERTRAVRGIVALAPEPVLCGVGELDENLSILQALEQTLHLNLDDRLHLLATERVEDDDL